MLNRLLHLKARRIRVLRAEQRRLGREQQRLRTRIEAIRLERERLSAARSALLRQGGLLGRREIGRLRAEVAANRLSARALLAEAQSLALALATLETTVDECRQALAQLMRQQEKLSQVLEKQ